MFGYLGLYTGGEVLRQYNTGGASVIDGDVGALAVAIAADSADASIADDVRIAVGAEDAVSIEVADDVTVEAG